MTKTTKKIIKIYLFADFLLILAGILGGVRFIISSQVAFVCATLVILASFSTYKNLIYDEIHSGKFDNQDEIFDDENSKKKNLPKVAKFHFFSFSKIFAYTFMFACFYALGHFGILHAFGFVCGIAPVIITAFWAFWVE